LRLISTKVVADVSTDVTMQRHVRKYSALKAYGKNLCSLERVMTSCSFSAS